MAAVVQLEQNQPLHNFDGLWEAQQYINANEFGYFSLLTINSKGKKQQRQRSYLNRYLADVLPGAIADANSKNQHLYISQSSFKCGNRQRASFLRSGVLFVDFDIYDSKFLKDRGEHCNQSAVKERILLACDALGIPHPSIIVHSGNGLYAKWLLSDPVHANQLPYWEVIQQKLNESFEYLGADKNAIDASRVLRVVGTNNLKYGRSKPCSILHVTHDSKQETSRYRMTEFESILPYSLPDVAEFKARSKAMNDDNKLISREKRQRLQVLESLREMQRSGQLDVESITPDQLNNHIKTTLGIKRFSLDCCKTYLPKFLDNIDPNRPATAQVLQSSRRFTLVRRNWGVYRDIMNLIDHRYGTSGVEDGLRDIFLFVAANFLAKSEWNKSHQSQSKLEEQFFVIAKVIAPDWDSERIKTCVSAVSKRLSNNYQQQSDPSIRIPNQTKIGSCHLYNMSDRYLIEKLCITSEELQADGLLTHILGDEERNRRNPDHHQQIMVKKREQKRAERQRKGIISRHDYNANRTKSSDDKSTKAKQLKALGLKNADIASALNVHVKSVSRLLK